MKKINKTGLVAAVAVAVTAMAPQMAAAHNVKKARSAAKSVSSSSVQSAMERRLEMMEQELAALRGELAKTRSEAKAEAKATSEKVAAHSAEVDEKLAAKEDALGKDLLFFRGGYASMEHARQDELLVGNSADPTTTRPEKDGEGWYVGAGFDHDLTDDMWGLWDGAEVDGEVMFEYKNFGTSTNTLVNLHDAGTPGALGIGHIENKITQFTLTASPKIKFKTGTLFTPWVIPFGLGIHVISPPSSGVTVLNPGLMIGAGGEFRLWKSLVAGLDFRYHFTGDDLNFKSSNGVLNKVDTDGFTTGAYLGFGF